MTVVARRRLLALVAVLALAVWGISSVLSGGDDGKRPSPLVPATGAKDPFAYDPGKRRVFEQRAAAGLAHVLYAKSPGGAVATAQRVARYRSIVDGVARRIGFDANTLEAIVFLESAGRPDARASDDPRAAAGLTQILAETGQNLLHMRIDTTASGRYTRRIARAQRRGQKRRAARLAAARRRVDERYDPPKAIAATGRYLQFARGQLGGRDDLAVASYHMGVGNLQNVLKAYGAGTGTPYAEVFFDSSPLRHANAWDILASLGDDSSTYLWRILAAGDIMRRFRQDPAALTSRARAMLAKNSAEEVLHPRSQTAVFERPSDIAKALSTGALTPITARSLTPDGVRLDPGMGALASKLGQQRVLYRALRPEALALVLYLARGTKAIGKDTPLLLTSTVRDTRYQRLLTVDNPEATQGYSLHTTGWAFDVERTYRSRRQALAFQFMLDRLTALNLIAWVREPAAIHVTAGPDAEKLLGLLKPATG